MKLFFRALGLFIVIGLGIGSASALFLEVLAFVTQFRENHLWILWFLPFAGGAIAWAYAQFGSNVETGTLLILDEIAKPKRFLPARLMPMILVGTWLTHLFGGSAGREGTAIQMGGAIADRFARHFKLTPAQRSRVFLAGLAGGFGSVFGVPWAGAVFALEVGARSKTASTVAAPFGIATPFDLATRMRSQAGLFAISCLTSFVAHETAIRVWKIEHSHYPTVAWLEPTFDTALKIFGAGILLGLMARAFVGLMHLIRFLFEKHRLAPALKGFAGGSFILLGYDLLGTTRDAGLGLNVIADAFTHRQPASVFLTKIAMTVLTLGCGMRGGEVTPLLYIGSTFASFISGFFVLPLALLAGVGLVGVFAGAASAPLACAVMAVELFGWKIAPWALLTCWTAAYVSGPRALYPLTGNEKLKLESGFNYVKSRLRSRARS